MSLFETTRGKASSLKQGFRHYWLCLSLIFAVVLLAVPTVSKAQSAKASISPNTIRIDAYTRYTIRLEGAMATERPLLNLPPEVQVVPGSEGTQREINIINGVQREFLTFSWTVTVDRIGEFIIPTQEVMVSGGKKLSTNEVKIVVSNDAKGDDQRFAPILNLEIGKVRFYEGEQIPITAKLLTYRGVQLRRLSIVEMPKQDFAIQRFPLQANEELEEIAGETYVIRSFTTQLNALKTGSFELGPASMEVTLDVPLQDSFFGQQRSLFLPTETRRVNAKSNTVKVEVLPLPKDGKPANFSGAIGTFRLKAVASPTKLVVGEPISVELLIEGSGNFDSLSSPELSNPKDWKTYPAKRFQVERKTDVSDPVNRLGFNQVIIPTTQHAQIPAYELTYFDPESGQYVTARTEPIPLELSANPSSSSQIPPSTPSSSISGEEDISQNFPQPPKAELNDIVEIDLDQLPKTVKSVQQGSSLIPVSRLEWLGLGLLLIGILFHFAKEKFTKAPSNQVLKLRELKRALRQSRSSDQEFYRNLVTYLDHVGDDSPHANRLREQAYASIYTQHSEGASTGKKLTSKDRSEIQKSLNI